MAARDAGCRARHIGENAVEGTPSTSRQAGCNRRLNERRQSQALKIARHARAARWVRIERSHSDVAVSMMCAVSRPRGARVEHALTLRQLEATRCACCSPPHPAPTPHPVRIPARAPSAAGARAGARSSPTRRAAWPAPRASLVFGQAHATTIDAQAHRWMRVACRKQFFPVLGIRVAQHLDPPPRVLVPCLTSALIRASSEARSRRKPRSSALT